jgi:(1->4)-alpha-D-glucan 1-alpha-D-glucosylmutase
VEHRIAVVPLSTYRLQFSPRFRFADASAIVPYLAELGIGAIYASPYLRARPGSEHGYDVVDHNALNPEIGNADEHRAMIAAAQEHGLGHVLDFVPNHMGILGMSNAWWFDVLEWGQDSPFAKFFDIEWHPQRADLAGKVLLPFLGDHYGQALERGELKPRFDAERRMFVVTYYDLEFPLAPQTYAPILAHAAALADARTSRALRTLEASFELNGGDARARTSLAKDELAVLLRDDPSAASAVERSLGNWRPHGSGNGEVEHLHALLEQQHYRLASWRVSLHEINYRRFFDINELAALRVEDAEVLAQTHRLIFDMIADGRLQGLRIDHIDGLFNPGAYCRLLRERSAVLDQPLYLLVEKILARFERLSKSWSVDGTTGYDFMNEVNELFVSSRSEAAFDRIYTEFAASEERFEDVAYTAKQYIMRNVLSSELTLLANSLSRIALSDVRSSDYTYEGLRDAIAGVVAAFPVYRTYISGGPIDEEDLRFIEWAVVQAARHSEVPDDTVFEFVADVLTGKILETPHSHYDPGEVLHFTMKFQQYTGPVMAKAVEDTAFYRYVRLISLNEVGGDPRRFGAPTATFHRRNSMRAEDFPRTLLATATHDHKRGEDTRLRIDALSEMPGRWRQTLRALTRIAKERALVESMHAPTRRDEYAIYQTLVGTWPTTWLQSDERPPEPEVESYVARLSEWCRKTIREAKLQSSWTHPNEAYEEATLGFIRRIFEGGAAHIFQREMQRLLGDVALVAMVSGLSQVTLKLTSPGVADVYQGCELWDFSLVDPDNRRNVDFVHRARLLEEIRRDAGSPNRIRFVQELLGSWPDGRIKMFVTWSLLQLRKAYDAAFVSGSYRSLRTGGRHGNSLVAYARDHVIVVAPRLVYPVLRRMDDGMPHLDFSNEYVALTSKLSGRYTNIFTNEEVHVESTRRPRLDARTLLKDFPVAVLVPKA